MKIERVHCLFEQSGTFKNEFIKLGIPAEDYDILDDFGETDHIIDLFKEIRGGYCGKSSIFDAMTERDLIIAFFPCTRFEDQIMLWFRGQCSNAKQWNTSEKINKSMELHNELHEMYMDVSKLVAICLRRGLRLIIENPYSAQHYLRQYWCLKPSIIDTDRTRRGDQYKKPTQYYFINCEPEHNFIFEPLIHVERKKCKFGFKDGKERSMIHPQYANRFVREFILDGETTKTDEIFTN
jgi:hypothetical protein